MNGLGDITAGSLNGDLVVLLEVDTSVLLGRVVGGAEQLTFQTGVARAGNVLAVLPPAIARAAGRVTTAGTATAAAAVTTTLATIISSVAAAAATTAPTASSVTAGATL